MFRSNEECQACYRIITLKIFIYYCRTPAESIAGWCFGAAKRASTKNILAMRRKLDLCPRVKRDNFCKTTRLFIARATMTAATDSPDDVLALESWLERWRSRLTFISEAKGCGCCVRLLDVEGPL